MGMSAGTTLILLFIFSGPQSENEAISLAVDEGYLLRGDVNTVTVFLDTTYQIDMWKDDRFGVVEFDQFGVLTWIPDADLSCGDNGCVVTYPDK